MKKTRGPGQRAGLSRAQVLAATQELVDRDGLAALTMRALAQRLGVSPNTLYSHVSNKTDLLDELLDQTLAAVRTPPEGTEPSAAITALMVSTYEVLLERASLVPAFFERQGARGPVAQQLGEWMRGWLGELGVAPEHRQQALRVLIVYTMGYAAFAVSTPSDPAVDPAVDPGTADSFRQGLGWLINGIGTQAALAAPSQPHRSSAPDQRT